MNFKQYVTALVELNYDRLQAKTSPRYYAAITSGLTEELLELSEAEGTEENIYEMGDVFAYTALILISNQLSNGLHLYSSDVMDSLITEVADSLSYAFDFGGGGECPTHLALLVVSKVKRYFREDEPVGDAFVANICAMAYEYMTLSLVDKSVTIAQVLEANIEKLSKRKAKGVMYKGSGNKR